MRGINSERRLFSLRADSEASGSLLPLQVSCGIAQSLSENSQKSYSDQIICPKNNICTLPFKTLGIIECFIYF